MQHVKLARLAVVAFSCGLGALASANVSAQDVIAVADGVDMWDGQWHFDATIYGWVPWVYSTVQLPAIAGGANPTITTEPSDYLKDVKAGALLQGTIRNGDWSIWTDLVYLNLADSNTNLRQIGLPGVNATVPVSVYLNTDVKSVIWTLAPLSYTVVHNDIGTLDVMAGIRYVYLALSLNYVLSVPPLNLTRSGGFSPSADATDGLIGVRGALRLSSDGKWFLPYEADYASGSHNWNWNAMLGVGYHFRWGDLTLGGRNFTYKRTESVIVEKERFTGPAFGATFRW
jgi:hypothetical protein